MRRGASNHRVRRPRHVVNGGREWGRANVGLLLDFRRHPAVMSTMAVLSRYFPPAATRGDSDHVLSHHRHPTATGGALSGASGFGLTQAADTRLRLAFAAPQRGAGSDESAQLHRVGVHFAERRKRPRSGRTQCLRGVAPCCVRTLRFPAFQARGRASVEPLCVRGRDACPVRPAPRRHSSAPASNGPSASLPSPRRMPRPTSGRRGTSCQDRRIQPAGRKKREV